MSNPYDQLLRKEEKPPPKPKPKPAPSSSSSSVLSKPKKRAVTKPSVRFNVRPRYRFDLPDPPMDPKMLLGQLSTASYATPYISQLERDFRNPAIPADPTHGLHPNLVESALYTQSATLSVDDDALLLSVTAGRPGFSGPKGLPDGRRAQKIASRRSGAATTTPWMRRMGYDEYNVGSSNVSRHKPTVKEEEAAAEKLANARKNDPKMIERRRRQMIQSFDVARRNPTHPDKRKANLKPVHITPILPDLLLLGQEFVAFEFDKDDVLTVKERVREDPEATEESVRSLAAMVVKAPRKSTTEKPIVACYTPSDDTLKKRKRRREEKEGPTTDEKERKKVHFVEEEMYEWIGEYSVRERKLGTGGADGVPSRSCFALTEHVGEDKNNRVALLSRIPMTWQLFREPGTQKHHGKPDLKISRDDRSTVAQKVQHDIVAGVSKPQHVKNENLSL